jgi:hexosaminidase
MKAIGAMNSGELQSYFIKRIEDYLKTKNRRIIGWDEILEGGVAPDATVQSWRGVDGAIAAANSGHDAIVSPTSHAYFDYSVKTTSIDKVYEFDPVPKELNLEARKHILGGECNMWTEYAPQELVDSKVFPRVLAMSEVLWTYPGVRDKEAFLARVQTQYPRLDHLGVKYGYERQAVQFSTSYNEQNNTFLVSMTTGQQGLEMYYTTNGSNPDKNSALYQKPFALSSSAEVKVRVAKNGVLQNEAYSINLAKHNAIGKKITCVNPYSEKYTAGGNAGLLDGIRGSDDYHDHWQGFQKNDMIVMIDMGEKIRISKVTVGCLQAIPSWIFFPQNLELSVSDNGVDYISVSILSKLDLPQDNETRLRDFTFSDLKNIEARYIKIKAKNIEYCPVWHDAAGGEAWLFVDEIIIE